jgi:putative endonuclease
MALPRGCAVRVRMTRGHDFGRACERIAERFLCRAGWTILARNYRFRHREVDLIARKGAVIAFVEVKGRSDEEFGHPLHAITAAKRREIESAARQWVARHGRCVDTYRFDAIAITVRGRRRMHIEHVEDAWRI